MDENQIADADGARAAQDGQWVEDSEGKPWCLIDTHLGFPQRMAMYKTSLTAVENLAYPLHLADFVGECEHKWGTAELGHCYRCGVVVGEPRPVFFDEGQMALFEAAGRANARAEPSCSQTEGADRG